MVPWSVVPSTGDGDFIDIQIDINLIDEKRRVALFETLFSGPDAIAELEPKCLQGMRQIWKCTKPNESCRQCRYRHETRIPIPNGRENIQAVISIK